MNNTKSAAAIGATNIIAKRKLKLIALFVVLVFVSFKLSQHLISVIIPELQQMIGCKNGTVAYSDCKYTGLASIITAPIVLSLLVAFIVIAIVSYRKRRKLTKAMQMDSATNTILCLIIILCTIMTLFVVGMIVYEIIVWSYGG